MTSRFMGERFAKLVRSAKGLPHRLAHAGAVALEVLYWTATFQLVSRLRRRRHARIIRRSGLFNAQFYLSQCGDDPEAQRDPLTHYLVRGAARGLEPNPLFDSAAYLRKNPSDAAPRNNPLVDFIRSGGSAARIAPSATPDSRIPVVPARETLLLDHPLLASSVIAPGPDTGRVLVVDPRMQMSTGDAGSVRTFGIVKLLHELGCAVTFVSDRPATMGDLEDPLRQLGIDVHDGFPAAVAHLAAEGHQYRWALLSGPEQAFRYLPAVRAYCLRAKVIYDRVRPPGVRLNGERVATTNAASREEEAERLERMDRVNAACSDVVLAVTPEERHALLAKVPGARVEVTPQFQAWGSDTDLVKGRLEFLLFGPTVGDPDVQRDGRSIKEGWPA